jgi:hypothetical protein
MDLLYCLRSRPTLEHLKLRKLAIEYFCKNRVMIGKEANYAIKRDRLCDIDDGVDLVKELLV